MTYLKYSLFALLGLLSFSASAQRHIKGQLALSPYATIVDQFPSTIAGKGGGYGAGLELIRYTKTENYWKISYQYDRKTYVPFQDKLISERYWVSFDYSPFSLHNHRRQFYLAPTVGANLGLETINSNNYELPQGTILNQSTALFGANVGLDAEVYLAEKVALLVMIQERYLPYSNLAEFRTYGSIGLRFSFFKN